MSLKRRKWDESVSECIDENAQKTGPKRARTQSFVNLDVQALHNLSSNQVDSNAEHSAEEHKDASLYQRSSTEPHDPQGALSMIKEAPLGPVAQPDSPYFDINTLLKELHYQRIMRHGLDTLQPQQMPEQQ